MHKAFKVLWGNDPALADHDVREFAAALVEMNEDGSVKRVLGCDRGEPEDNSLHRDWSWVATELNQERAKRKVLGAALTAIADGPIDRGSYAYEQAQTVARKALRADEGGPVKVYDLIAHLHRQREFSLRTFGPGPRAEGVVDHIRKELREIEADPTDIEEWIDVVLLAFDGAYRAGHEPEQIAAALEAKLAKNERRTWPDWRSVPAGKAIEHDRTKEPRHG